MFIGLIIICFCDYNCFGFDHITQSFFRVFQANGHSRNIDVTRTDVRSFCSWPVAPVITKGCWGTWLAKTLFPSEHHQSVLSEAVISMRQRASAAADDVISPAFPSFCFFPASWAPKYHLATQSNTILYYLCKMYSSRVNIHGKHSVHDQQYCARYSSMINVKGGLEGKSTYKTWPRTKGNHEHFWGAAYACVQRPGERLLSQSEQYGHL